ncbi:PKD domain-containing protein [Nocardia sp. NPDC005978]|uniref:PKD domain-containing protein n=1 Tax=unclassified Nocardia TaxID=2637762 RepID=UPI0033AF1A8E
MRLWRSRWYRAAILPGLAGAVVLGGPVARADARTDYPLIIDVSTPADRQCDGPLRGTTAVFYPPGVPAGADVEWRILAGEQPIRSGITPASSEVVTVGFDIRPEELPADGLLRIDARARIPGGQVGGYGKPWNFRVSRECSPLHVVSIGDAVTWGQGLGGDRKFAHLTAETLGSRTGRGAQVHDYSVPGAVLDAPGLPAGNDDSACPPAGADLMPDVFCQLNQAAADARAHDYTVDLVLLTGCINDLDPLFGIPVGVTPGTQDLDAAVRRECGGEGAEPENPAAHVPYFSGAKDGYGGRGMAAAITAAHQLPGSPKVMVGNYFHGHDTEDAPDGLRQRWSEFVRSSAEVFRRAAARANAEAGRTFAVAADGLSTADTDLRGGAPWMNPLGDEAVSLRLLACPQWSELPPQCRTDAGKRRDVRGAQQYADAFLMNPRVRDWFGGGGPGGEGFLASRESGPAGVTVDFDAALAGGAIRQYEWHFGDGDRVVTTAPVVAHVYRGHGPHLPRLVVTDMTGHRSLYELPRPIVIG